MQSSGVSTSSPIEAYSVRGNRPQAHALAQGPCQSSCWGTVTLSGEAAANCAQRIACSACRS